MLALIDTFLQTAAYLGRASLASGGVAGPLHALTLAGTLQGRGEIAPGDEGAEVGVVGEDVVANEFREERDEIGKGRAVLARRTLVESRRLTQRGFFILRKY